MKLTNDHYYKFQQSVVYWMNKLKLNDWKKEIIWQDNNNYPAGSNYNFETRTVKLKISREWTMPLTDKNIDKVAKHEVLHILLFILDYYQKIGQSRTDFRREEEEVVKKLTDII